MRKNFLSSDALDRAANEMARLARAQNIRAAVIGGLAMQLYGSDRLTMDVDFIAERKLDGPTVRDRVAFGGEKLVSSDGVPVDWIVRTDAYRALYEEALGKAERVEGQDYLVITLPYLAAMKMAARRDKDFLDLTGILLAGSVDVQEARGIVLRHLGEYAAEDFDDRAAQARWRKERGK
jgi:hypothetical protein